VPRSSDSVNSHWDSARRRSSLGSAGGWREGDLEAELVEFWILNATGIFNGGSTRL
jgi:hypothetical protein